MTITLLPLMMMMNKYKYFELVVVVKLHNKYFIRLFLCARRLIFFSVTLINITSSMPVKKLFFCDLIKYMLFEKLT